MCETGHNHISFTTVEQKIAWEYLEAYLRYTDSIVSCARLLKNKESLICMGLALINFLKSWAHGTTEREKGVTYYRKKNSSVWRVLYCCKILLMIISTQLGTSGMIMQ